MLMDLVIVLMSTACLMLYFCVGEFLRINITRIYRLIHIRKIRQLKKL